MWDVDPPVPTIGTLEVHLLKHFFEAVVANARLTLHVHNVSGDNTHHVFESVFKAVAVALRRWSRARPDGGPEERQEEPRCRS